MTEITNSDVGESGKCLNANCENDADVAAICDTGQVKHYCNNHGNGRRAGHSIVEEWVEL